MDDKENITDLSTARQIMRDATEAANRSAARRYTFKFKADDMETVSGVGELCFSGPYLVLINNQEDKVPLMSLDAESVLLVTSEPVEGGV